MPYKISRLLIITTLISLAACGGGDSAVTPADPNAGGAEIQITINEVVSLDGSTSRIQYTIKNMGDADTGNFDVVGWHNRASVPDYLEFPHKISNRNNV